MGFPYDSVQALTTPKQILEIMNEIENENENLMLVIKDGLMMVLNLCDG